jgi:hypothetical protein
MRDAMLCFRIALGLINRLPGELDDEYTQQQFAEVMLARQKRYQLFLQDVED